MGFPNAHQLELHRTHAQHKQKRKTKKPGNVQDKQKGPVKQLRLEQCMKTGTNIRAVEEDDDNGDEENDGDGDEEDEEDPVACDICESFVSFLVSSLVPMALYVISVLSDTQ